ncbi:uncharacterized protein LOC101858178 isoform X2 [Aplysia californica]|uniref:Uncharacterized protein LOC101858178 isoform X2 n=1 Tax=Aplysia californica TaxID=6500 RepID=A0ABM0ZYD9_APLCA|nr:uncharacterized protein LOC101858178 isoform X2 [Aplysia californica]
MADFVENVLLYVALTFLCVININGDQCGCSIEERVTRLENEFSNLRNEHRQLQTVVEENNDHRNQSSPNITESTQTGYYGVDNDHRNQSSPNITESTQTGYYGVDMGRHNRSGSNYAESAPTETVTGDDGDVVVQEVRRTRVPEGVKFTVRYYASPYTDLRVRWTDDSGANIELEPTLVLTTERGVFESEVVTAPQSNSSVTVRLRTPKQRLSLQLRNVEEDDVLQRDISFPVLRTIPQGDIVYEQGQNVDFQIVRSRGNGSSPVTSSKRYIILNPIDHTKAIIVVSYSDFEFSSVEAETTSQGLEYLTRRLRMTSRPTSGVVLYTLNMPKSDVLIERAQIRRTVVIRPSTQSEAFPRGFLDIPNSRYNEILGNRSEVATCSNMITPGCFIACYGAGEDIVRMTLWKVRANGYKERVEEQQVGEDDHYGYVVKKVQPDSGPVSQSHYQCEAVNTEGEIVTRDYFVNFIIGAEIIQEESRVTRINETLVEVQCVAAGNPPPEVLFFLTYGEFKQRDIEPSSVSTNAQNHVVATLYAPTSTTGDYYRPGGPLNKAACNARGPIGGEYSFDYYEWPVVLE